MILYHGSNTTIDKIDLKKSKPNKDFGKGFYLSEDEEQAIEMAKYKSSILGGLYFQSSLYIYSYLKNEITSGVIG